jgi:hypothetical protein
MVNPIAFLGGKNGFICLYIEKADGFRVVTKTPNKVLEKAFGEETAKLMFRDYYNATVGDLVPVANDV